MKSYISWLIVLAVLLLGNSTTVTAQLKPVEQEQEEILPSTPCPQYEDMEDVRVVKANVI